MKSLFILAFASAFVLAMTSCDSDSGNDRLEVYLTDAPGDYESVNIEIAGVEIHTSEGDQDSGWKTLEVNRGVYDLLELTNGLDTLLGSIEIPAGRISQVRLKLGQGNSLVIDGETFALATPGGLQSGLKLQVHQVLAEGITYKILIDFDVARSIVRTGNGSYILKPVLRTITEAQDGAIMGRVNPAASTPAVYAIIGEDTVGTSYADEAGKFLIRGLDAGNYTVAFAPNSEYIEATKENVSVEVGSVTDIGVVDLEIQ